MTPFLSMCVLDVADGTASLYVLTMMMMAIIIRFNDKQNMSLVVCFWMKKTTDKYELPLEIKKTEEKTKTKKNGKRESAVFRADGRMLLSLHLSEYIPWLHPGIQGLSLFFLSLPKPPPRPNFLLKTHDFCFQPSYLIFFFGCCLSLFFFHSFASFLFFISNGKECVSVLLREFGISLLSISIRTSGAIECKFFYSQDKILSVINNCIILEREMKKTKHVHHTRKST